MGFLAGPRAPRYNTFTVEGWTLDSSEQLGSAAPHFVNVAISYLLESNSSCEGLSSLVLGEEELRAAAAQDWCLPSDVQFSGDGVF